MKFSTIITLALAGTAIAMLFTTDKGREYRTTAMDSAKKLGKKLRGQAEDMVEQAPEMKKQMADAVA